MAFAADLHLQLVESVHDFAIFALDADGNVASWNRGAELIKGYAEAEILGKPYAVFFDAEDTAQRKPARLLERAIADGRVEDEGWRVRKDGSRFWANGVLSVVRDEHGDHVGFARVTRDLTTRRQADELAGRQRTKELTRLKDLIHLQAELLAHSGEERVVIADRMAAVASMATGVAHEINNPLACAISNIEMISESVTGLAASSPSAVLREMKELLADAREGCERIRHIVRDLRAFSPARDASESTLDVNQAAESAIATTVKEIRQRAVLVKDLGPVPPVRGDEARLGQALVSILLNAAQAIPHGDSDGNEVRVSTRTSREGDAVIEIRDSGAGIPPELHRRVFYPFFTTKKVGEATGLGLAITQSIVGEMGGRVELESEVGKGSLFRVVLPAAAEAQPGESSHDLARSTQGDVGRVFVVDDDLIVGKSFGRVLRDHDVVVFSDARVALEHLRSGDVPDVILCDLMMPEMTGIDFYEELKRTLPEYVNRVVFLTGGAFTDEARAFLDEIPNARLEKPVDNVALRAVVSSVLLRQ